MTRLTHFPLRHLAIAAMTVSMVALAPAVSAASPRSGDLHVTKECSEYGGLPGEFCTITSSNIPAIKAGSKVVYASGVDWNTLTLDSDITIARKGRSIAAGHVFLNLQTGTGTVTVSGGSGQFIGFSASADVSYAGGPNWAWDGTYSFSPPVPS